MGCIYVIRTFVRRGKGLGALPPTICFERDLALDMEMADETGGEGIAGYEIDSGAESGAKAKPFAAFGRIPDDYWRIGRDALLSSAPSRPSLSVVAAG